MADKDESVLDAELRRALDATKAREGTPIDAELADLRDRIEHLRAASRPGGPLTDKDGPTAQGHILSAITKLERQLELLSRKKASR